MFLCYMDESGDPGPNSPVPTYTVASVLVHDTQWLGLFERVIEFRRYLRKHFGLYMRTEAKGAELAKGTGPWIALGLSDPLRKRIYRAFLRLQHNSGAVQTYAVVIDKSKRPMGTDEIRERAWRYALQRVESFCRKRTIPETVMLVPDSGQYLWLRRLARGMRRFSPVGSAFGGPSFRRDLLRVLIDDPVERQSHESYMVQLADFNAYAAYRNGRPDPAFPKDMWLALDDAILLDANKLQLQKYPGGTPGIVDGP